ncbi:hypothetical protein GCM10011514_33940 [Emticicia aquatilis]|uniref:Secretion system C-terminal sorting domain-containing protein n=2 Tax=Emticicia aquatilis TaxID=1537369 RepID=A0A917DTD9_9BACT|nr:hypothetical protein GCM10011514_33940 [Emticicia aquatilis]
MPKICTNPGNGILVGGDFSTNIEYGCIDAQSPNITFRVFNGTLPSGEQSLNLSYIFNFKDGDPLVFGNTSSTTVSKPGTYWILQAGNYKGQVYITCKAVEVIQTEQPDVSISTCGDKNVTITFLNTPKNQKHNSYRIIWGDDNQTFIEQITKSSFPFSLEHIYNNIPTKNLIILSGYRKANMQNDICRSEPLSIPIPVIKELPAPESISTVSVDNSNTIKYSILETSGRKAKYLYYRSINGNNFEKVAESIDNFYIDKDVDLSKNQYCYAYKYEDICGVQSALSINKNCNVKLSLNNTNLEWTPFSIDTKSKAIPEYSIEGLNDDNSFITQVGTTTKTNFNILDVWNIIPNNITKFRIQAKITEGTFPSIVYSNSVTLPILSTSKEADSFKIYPNPSEDFVQLNSTLQLKTAEIVDLQGKVIENQSIENGQVSVKHLPKGKYILRLYGNDKKLISSKAIIKM